MKAGGSRAARKGEGPGTSAIPHGCPVLKEEPLWLPTDPNDPYRADPTDEKFAARHRLDNELQADPELAEGPASGTRIAMFALAIAVVLGAVFYGLNSSPSPGRHNPGRLDGAEHPADIAPGGPSRHA